MSYGLSFINFPEHGSMAADAIIPIEAVIIDSPLHRIYQLLTTDFGDGQPIPVSALLSDKVPEELRQFVRDNLLAVQSPLSPSASMEGLSDDDLHVLSPRTGELQDDYVKRVQTYLDTVKDEHTT